MSDLEEERIQREKDFHNNSFQSDVRDSALKYYKSASIGKSFYREKVLTGIDGKKTLEYGCGPGSASFELAKKGADVYAIDISEVAIEQALEKAENERLVINAQVMDAENLDFGDQAFDLICGSGILHHLDLNRSYSEIQRVLKKTGRGIFFEPLGHNPLINLYRTLTPKMRTEDEHPLLMKDLKLAEQYFEKVNVTHFNLSAIAATFLPSLSTKLNAFDSFLFKKLPFLKKHSWIVVIEFLNPK